jgi:cytochrome P450
MVLQPYGNDWRRSRKLLHPHVHTNAVPQYQPVQLASARMFVRKLLSTEPTPDALPALVRADFAETIVKTVYGIDVKTKEEREEYIDIPTIVLEKLNEAAIPGRFLVDGLNFCKFVQRTHIHLLMCHIVQHIPAWIPGAAFQTFAKEAKRLHHRSREAPMKMVRAQMENGTASPSIVRSMLEDVSPDDQQAQDTIRDLGAIAFLGVLHDDLVLYLIADISP